MDKVKTVPISVTLSQARTEIVTSIEQIGNKYQIPLPFLLTIADDIIKDSKIAAYESVFSASLTNSSDDITPDTDTN